MVAQSAKVIQVEHKNERANNPLILPILVLPNTPDEEIQRNIAINSARDLAWITQLESHDGVALIVGGGYSARDDLLKIRSMKAKGASIFAMNGASKWCSDNGMQVDYQCILDAKEETKALVDGNAQNHIFASQVNPETMNAVKSPIVWHCHTGNNIEKYFPPEKVAQGGYALLSGGSAVGNSAMNAIYALGFRDFHVFGLDSCHRDGESHNYSQPMNRFIPTVKAKWAGKSYIASVAMKAQAEDFQITSQALKQLGCKFTVHGEGLLQAMYNTPVKNLSEHEKYQLMWTRDEYRAVCPGEHLVDIFLEIANPDSVIIDYGCGTGRTSLSLFNKGHDVMLMDFTDNSRDQEAFALPFIQWDITNPIPASAEYGICTDVMEHIPTDDVDKVIDNILSSADNVFFQISTIDDVCGEIINAPLHLTVKPHSWWKNLFILKGYKVEWECEQETASLFYISMPES